jgi:NAD(P)-dependent dehydrogenase (short-subunit alcohol dehydrogenase family)
VTTETYSLQGKVAAITGGNRGIGFAVAEALVAEGCHVVIGGRDPQRLEAAERALSKGLAQVTALTVNLCDPQSVEAFVAAIRTHHPTVHILVNSAGLAHVPSPVAQFTLDTWKQVVDTDLTGMFLCTRACLPLMLEGGTIVNVLSTAATQASAGNSAYHASKWGALGFTNSLREELRGRGIRVVGLLPGAVATDMWDIYGTGVPRDLMVSPATLAETVVHVVTRPPQCTIEEIRIGPVLGLGIFAAGASKKPQTQKA